MEKKYTQNLKYKTRLTFKFITKSFGKSEKKRKKKLEQVGYLNFG